MKRTMGLWDIIFMNVTAIIGLRWIPIAAGYGASSISLWLVAGFLLLIPLGLVSSELATTWPDQGGMYVWIRKAFGERWAFLTSWFYWINNLFFYPSLLTFIAVTIAFVTDPVLAQNKFFVCSVILTVFWSVTLINCKGMALGKWLSALGGTFGTLLPGLVIIVLGFASLFVWHRPVHTGYSLASWLPSLNSGNIAFLSTLMFAMAGIELTPILAGETENPQRTFPLATLISAVLIVGTYMLGTLAMTWIIDPTKIGAASGIMDAVKLIATEMRIPGVLEAIALMIIIGSFGGVSVWTIGPIKMLFESTRDGILPKAFTQLNRNGAPQNAMLAQACIITIIVLATSFLPSVNRIYQVLILMTTITYFIPYLLMFAAFLRLRKLYPDVERPYRVPNGMTLLVALMGTASVVLAIAVSLFPPADVKGPWDLALHELTIVGGTVLLGALGGWLHHRSEVRNKQKEQAALIS